MSFAALIVKNFTTKNEGSSIKLDSLVEGEIELYTERVGG